MLPGMIGGMGGLSSPVPFDPATLFAGTAGGYWLPTIIGATRLWKDTAGTSAVTADGDAVARMDDLSGNGNHLLQATLANRPLYKTSGGLEWLVFDGSDDYLRVAFTMGTAWDRLSGMQFVSLPLGVNEQYFGGVTTNECIYGSNSNTLTQFQGGNGAASAAVVTATDYVVTERWAPTAGQGQVALDNGAYSSAAVTTINPGGVTVGASNSTGDFANFRLHGLLMIDRTLTSGEIALMRTFLGAKQARGL